ncbi:YitT family protein [Butyrivibrio sp. LB2008]|uniref:YitT family protein n=1 Tax=Butyrivibrio sp. LB2008 TaxID=1408305 RepID=UPI0004798EE4|nr:YitT family protein [Butyrivibrio sp. LB2008]
MDVNIKENHYRWMSLRLIVVTFASVVFAINIKSFVRTGGILPGGATGLTLLFQEIADRFVGIKVPYTPINVAINLVPVYIGFKFIGKKFTSLSCIAIVLTGILADLIPGYVITNDIILISIFGGIINGVAVSLCLLMDATSGGIDFIAIYLYKKGADGFNVALYVNACILITAGALFGWERALYSIVFQYVSTTVIHVLYRKYQQTTLFIVTQFPDEISALIYDMTNHGSTIIYGRGAHEEEKEKSVVYSVISATQVTKAINAIKIRDPEAFVNVFKSERISGKFYRIPED